MFQVRKDGMLGENVDVSAGDFQRCEKSCNMEEKMWFCRVFLCCITGKIKDIKAFYNY